MIQSLWIHNIALIEELRIDFGKGLCALTGETGAGKSIVVDAVNLILGGRADRDLIRNGTDRASVEAVFSVNGNTAVQQWLTDQAMEETDEITVFREIQRSGRNVCRVQGVMIPLASLRELSGFLMDVHGQHEHRFLMDPVYHMQFLDASGDAAHQALQEATRKACEAFLDCHRRYTHLVRENEKKQYRMEELKKGLEELRKARLVAGEEEKLQKEQEKLRHSGRIIHAVNVAHSILSSGDEEALIPRLKTAVDALYGIADLDAGYSALHARLESAYFELEEAGFELASLLENGAFDPMRQEKVDTRLEMIRRLEKKYGGDIPSILKTRESMQEEYDRFSSLDTRMEEMQKEHRQLLLAYRSAAHALSESRKALAVRFEKQMMRELTDLGMGKTVFTVAFEEMPKRQLPQPDGEDRVSFMISANPGEPVKPLSRIASGGELSRLMLALKSLEAARGGVESMVFDEIDTGISGRMAQVVAEKMAKIAKTHQVLCVTHLPQIAAMADHALMVEKHEKDGRTQTMVHSLDAESRVLEVARMLAGADGEDESARAHARHMLESARAYRESQASCD